MQNLFYSIKNKKCDKDHGMGNTDSLKFFRPGALLSSPHEAVAALHCFFDRCWISFKWQSRACVFCKYHSVRNHMLFCLTCYIFLRNLISHGSKEEHSFKFGYFAIAIFPVSRCIKVWILHALSRFFLRKIWQAYLRFTWKQGSGLRWGIWRWANGFNNYQHSY